MSGGNVTQIRCRKKELSRLSWLSFTVDWIEIEIRGEKEDRRWESDRHVDDGGPERAEAVDDASTRMHS